MYLDYSEYEELSLNGVTEEEFDKLIGPSERVINILIMNYYQFHDFNKDPKWRQDAVKQAVTYQIDYFKKNNSMSLEDLNNYPQSFSAGRTSVSMYSSREGASDVSLHSSDTYNVLLS